MEIALEDTDKQVKLPPLKSDISKLTSPADYAKKVKLTRQTIYNYLEEGLLKKVVIAGRIFVDES